MAAKYKRLAPACGQPSAPGPEGLTCYGSLPCCIEGRPVQPPPGANVGGRASSGAYLGSRRLRDLRARALSRARRA